MFKSVALVSLPKQDLIRPPAALPVLAAICEDAKVDYTINDFNLWLSKNTTADIWQQIDDEWILSVPFDNHTTAHYQEFSLQLNKFVDHLIKSNPDLVAISMFSDLSGVCSHELIAELNRRPERKNFKIVIGGSGIQTKIHRLKNIPLCNVLLNERQIDYFIQGEGEVAFKELLYGNQYSGINNSFPEQLDDLDRFPFPSYKKIDPRDYNFLINPEVMITGSRGCVRHCTYCDVAKYWPKFRYRSGKSLARELYYYYKEYNIRHFEFSDSLINGSLRQFREMNQAVLALQETDPEFKISYKGQYICRSTDAMKEQDYEIMKRAGCDYIYVGVETFCEKVRYDMEKKFHNIDLDFHLEMCGKYGIKNSLLMLLGYPTETLENHNENIAALEKYQKYALADVISLIVPGVTANILDGTPLFDMKDQMHIVQEFHNLRSSRTPNWLSLDNPDLTLHERIRRWVEFTEKADSLGYKMPRANSFILRFIELIRETKGNKIIYQTTKQH